MTPLILCSKLSGILCNTVRPQYSSAEVKVSASVEPTTPLGLCGAAESHHGQLGFITEFGDGDQQKGGQKNAVTAFFHYCQSSSPS